MDARKFGIGNRESIIKAAIELKSNGELEQIIESASCVASNSSQLDADGWCIGGETRRQIGEWWNNS